MNIDWPTTFTGLKIVADAFAAAAWPIAILIVTLIFKRPIISAIERTRRVGGWGVTAEIEPPKQLARSDDGANARKTPGPADPPDDPVLAAFDRELRGILENNAPGDHERQLKWAIRIRSISESNRLHEYHYRLIFGSQVAALRALNAMGQVPPKEIENYFLSASENPQWEAFYKERTFDQWLGFLLEIEYVRIVLDTAERLIEITDFGKSYLDWMNAARAAEYRPA